MKRLFIVLILLLTSIIPNQLNGDINSTNDEMIQNTISNEIAIENLQDEITKDDEINVTQNDENEFQDNLSSKDEIVITETKQSQNESKSQNNIQPKNNSNSQKQESKNQTPKANNTNVKTQNTNPVQEQKQDTTPKTEIKQEVVKPQKQEAIYCVDGGKTHIYGDGANEHGYYKTWDEAFKAYEEYTKGWESTQFKVEQCACGLYYFWVTK